MLPLIEQDKANHFVYGAVLSFATIIFLSVILSVPPVIASVLGAVVGGAVGILKEVYDYSHKETHTPDIQDFVWTFMGSLTVSIPGLVV